MFYKCGHCSCVHIFLDVLSKSCILCTISMSSFTAFKVNIGTINVIMRTGTEIA